MKEKQKTFELEPVQQLLPADAQQRVMDQLYQFMELEHLYESAIREVKTKLEILDSEFKTKYDHNPIHHLEDRVKSPQSILEKLNRKGIPFSCENAKRELNDIAGVRVVCNYIDDIYTVADLLTAQDDVKLVKRKDYIQNPKPNGYRSLHLVIETPVYLSETKELVHVEVQIRTIAMNFWATLEHKMHYKFEGDGPDYITKELRECARYVAELDARMEELNNEIQKYGKKNPL